MLKLNFELSCISKLFLKLNIKIKDKVVYTTNTKKVVLKSRVLLLFTLMSLSNVKFLRYY